MDPNAPDPAVRVRGTSLWVAYRIGRDRDHFAVLCFGDMQRYTLSEPGVEHLHEHPLFPDGLRHYGFHEVTPPAPDAAAGSPSRRWVVSFRDETLDVVAGAAELRVRALAAPSSESALASILT
jgi:hypothetical protein